MLVFDGACFQRNTGQVKGATHLYCRTLQRGGYLVAVVRTKHHKKYTTVFNFKKKTSREFKLVSFYIHMVQLQCKLFFHIYPLMSIARQSFMW